MPAKKIINVINVAAKTINLAKAPLKPRPVAGRGGPSSTASCLTPPPIPTPPATHIRVCTPEQLRSICPPDPCICPEPVRPLTGGERLFLALILITKWLLFLGFIKWTDDLGIWGNTESTAELINSAKEKLSPVLKPKKEEAQESSYGFTYNLATMWNNFVSNVFYFIGVVPATAAAKAFGMVNNKKEDEPPPPPPPEDPKDKKKKVKYSGSSPPTVNRT